MFDACADPARLVRWWGPAGFTMEVEEIDLREGGNWRFVFTGPDGKTFKNHLVFAELRRPERFVVDHLSGPHYHGTVLFDDLGAQCRITMYWTFEGLDFVLKRRAEIEAGNEGNFDRLWQEFCAG